MAAECPKCHGTEYHKMSCPTGKGQTCEAIAPDSAVEQRIQVLEGALEEAMEMLSCLYVYSNSEMQSEIDDLSDKVAALSTPVAPRGEG